MKAEHPPELVGGYACVALRIATEAWSFQAVIANLVEQSARRKLEQLGRLGAVSARARERLADQLRLEHALRALHGEVVGIQLRGQGLRLDGALHRLRQRFRADL